MGLYARKPVLGGLQTTKGLTSLSICTDHPAQHTDFVIHSLESIIFKLATGEISIF